MQWPQKALKAGLLSTASWADLLFCFCFSVCSFKVIRNVDIYWILLKIVWNVWLSWIIGKTEVLVMSLAWLKFKVVPLTFGWRLFSLGQVSLTNLWLHLCSHEPCFLSSSLSSIYFHWCRTNFPTCFPYSQSAYSHPKLTAKWEQSIYEVIMYSVLSIKRTGCLTIPNVLIYITLYI